ncbi:hypothetical protein pb186bvf_020637 [Paramecium bursaria]
MNNVKSNLHVQDIVYPSYYQQLLPSQPYMAVISYSRKTRENLN